ncbi:MAG: response regulator [Myxococcota bacterium]|nr:response regulator [Myxococcota bacterium]
MSAPILIVDDDRDLCDVLADLLERNGYAPVVCYDGVEALGHLREGPRPLAILLDLEMPRMNGYELRAAQLADARLASIPVLLISDQHLVDRSRLGAIEIVPRPFTLERLLAAVAKHVDVTSRIDQAPRMRRGRVATLSDRES